MRLWTLGRISALLAVVVLGGCGAYQPGTPGHEPPSAGRYNAVSGEMNSSGR